MFAFSRWRSMGVRMPDARLRLLSLPALTDLEWTSFSNRERNELVRGTHRANRRPAAVAERMRRRGLIAECERDHNRYECMFGGCIQGRNEISRAVADGCMRSRLLSLGSSFWPPSPTPSDPRQVSYWSDNEPPCAGPLRRLPPQACSVRALGQRRPIRAPTS